MLPGVIFLILLLSCSGSLLADTLQGEIRLQAAREGPVWVGQELELNLDLMSTGLSFSGQQFSLPEVNGAFLMQADSSTVKLSETRAGETWQGLRYTFLLYPQRQGLLEVPSFEVRFSASSTYGGEPEHFRFNTELLNIETILPPGADPRGLVVTTTELKLRSSWDPGESDESALQLKTGDALKLTVHRSAVDVPAMVFSPLPAFAIDGLRAYPEAPSVEDKINRGELAGARTDSLTFICEQAGSYRIPDIQFQWWDPARQILNEEVVPGIAFDVVPNPAFADSIAAAAAESARRISWPTILVGISLLLVLLAAGRWCVTLFKQWWQKMRAEKESGEPWAFQQLLDACDGNRPADAYQAINRWLQRFKGVSGATTLLKLAQTLGNQELETESERLQSALIDGSGKPWKGRKLGELLSKVRREAGQQSKTRMELPPLNPL